MAIIVEDGTIVAGANSYLSVADVIAYFDLVGYSAYEALSPTLLQEQILYRAMLYIENKFRNRWKGERVSSEQTLAFPRKYVVVDGITIATNVIPQQLKNAVCEAVKIETAEAFALFPELDRGGEIKSELVGPIQTVYMDGAPSTVTHTALNAMLSGLVRSSVSVAIGRT